MDRGTNPGNMRMAARPTGPKRHYSDTIVVKVNAVIADLVPGYLEARHNELDEIWNRIAAADLDSLKVIGHRLRGSGEGYGFREITLLGAQIEDAAQAGDLHVVREATARLEEYVAVVSYVTDE
jgi:HPt (histidine-containing phosphotransfer) domain-containing protein